MFNDIKNYKIKDYGLNAKYFKNKSHQDPKNELIQNTGNIKDNYKNSIRQWEYRKKIEKLNLPFRQ